MRTGVKEKANNNFAFVVCIVIFMVVCITMMYAGVLGIPSYNGVLLACEFALCIMMIRRDHLKGVIISFVLMSISLLLVIKQIVISHVNSAIPGLCNNIIYVFALGYMARQFGIREKEAVTDLVTGLADRRGLFRILQDKTEGKEKFYVVCILLGNYKFVNDNYGHIYGDLLLKAAADRMSAVVGKTGKVARLSGEEFVVVLDGRVDAEETVNLILDRLREKITLIADDSRVDCYTSARGGISTFPNDTDDYEKLIKFADIALSHAVKEKSGKACFYDSTLSDMLNRQMELEKLIKEGLDKNNFYLVYQPQYKLNGKKLRGFEALLRMKTSDGTLVSPGEFIPVAEKGDLILKIDDYVLRRAMTEFKDIVEQTKEELTISINVSAKNIASADFSDKVIKILDETGFPAQNLEIEITEYCLVQSMDTTIENIKILRSYGIQVALDDFGTGYTSLSYLSKMPINLLKIDKSLVEDIENSDKNRDFVQAVIAMGHLMGCEVISEGVETEGQLQVLGNQECDFVQGFVWGKPLEYNVAEELSRAS